MNIGAITCFIMAGSFVIFAIIFALLKDKAAILISGFNELPKKERDNYDKARMSKDVRNLLFIYTGIFAVGGLLCLLFTSYFAIIAFIGFFILFFKNVQTNAKKAFEKYKL